MKTKERGRVSMFRVGGKTEDPGGKDGRGGRRFRSKRGKNRDYQRDAKQSFNLDLTPLPIPVEKKGTGPKRVAE